MKKQSKKRKFATIIIVCLFFFNCNGPKPDQNQIFISFLFRPTLILFGDSISAFWPVEEQLQPFIAIKAAFPIRNTESIIQSVIQEQGQYSACMYNGGVNDFLGNYIPTDAEITETVDRQVEALNLMRMKCGQILFINTWNVEFPWPVEAAIRLNLKSKAKINFVPRIDPEFLIDKSMLLDGGHLTVDGYSTLSKASINHFRKLIPMLSY